MRKFMLWNVKGLDPSVEDLLGGLLTYFASTMLNMQGCYVVRTLASHNKAQVQIQVSMPYVS